jgi:hypothetical protein
MPLTGSLVLTGQQADVLESFFYTTLLGGALAFRMIDPVRGFEAEFRFTAPPAFTPNATRTAPGFTVRASLALEQLPPTNGILVISSGASCVLLQGSAGAAEFSTSSEITLESSGFCFNGTAPALEGTESYTFDYARVNQENGENVSVDWEYTDANGTSIVTFHKDTGWSYALDAQHAAEPTIGCGAGTTVRKFTGDESQFPGFRDFSTPALDDSTAQTLCGTVAGGFQVNPKFYKISTIATLTENGSCGTPPSRAQGFRDYSWACTTSQVFQSGNRGQVETPPA